ncbi:MAG: hypothetical protein Cons2KO_25030 [Congregibacter sp.]
MSLILDALTRAERDKQVASRDVPDLLSGDLAVVERSTANRLWLLIACLALLVTVAVAARWWWVGARAGDSQTIPAAAADAPPAQRQERVEAASQTQPVGLSLSKRAAQPRAALDRAKDRAKDQAEISALYELEAAVADEEPKPSGEATAASDVQGITVDGPVLDVGATKQGAAPSAASTATEDRTGIDIANVLREAEKEMRKAGPGNSLSPHPAPLLDDLSQQFRDSVPTLMYLRHDFSSSDRSSVLINGQSLRPGQRTRGVEVREILADSIILRFAGKDFRLRALNRWVNL